MCKSAKAEYLEYASETELNRDSPDKDTEFRVERILVIRLRRGNLQYRVL